jgi:hypothetical protein
MSDLAERFEADLWDTIREAKAIGYSPTIFERMLNDHGGVKTAKKLIVSGDVQSGFERLAKLGRLDISMERKMLKPEYTSLFTRDELRASEWRLAQVAGAP